MRHGGGRVEAGGPVELDHGRGAERGRALPLHLHDGDDQAVGGRVRGADQRGQPLGGQQQLGGVLRQALLAFGAAAGQVHQDVVVVGQAADFVVRQARLEPAEGADDDAVRGVPEVDDLAQAFGTHPVAALQHLGLPLFEVVPVVADLTLQLVRDLRLGRLLRRLTGHPGLCASRPGPTGLAEGRLGRRRLSELSHHPSQAEAHPGRKRRDRNRPGIFSFCVSLSVSNSMLTKAT